MPALRCTNLTRIFYAAPVVNNVSLAIAPGDVYGLVGRNGAGKSTLLRMLAGYLAPSSGTVEVCGQVLKPCQTSDAVGALIEAPTVDGRLSGLRNVMVRALAQGLPSPKAASAEALESVGLDPTDREHANEYSLGAKQRLGLALALVGSPSVLLLDEPFNGLDPRSTQRLRALITHLAEAKGAAVVISSHDLDQLGRVATRYGVMRKGKLIAELTAEEADALATDYLVVESPSPQQATAVLEQAFPQARLTVMPDDSIRLAGAPGAEAVGRALWEAGVLVSALGSHELDPEDYFVNLMDSGRKASRRASAVNADGPSNVAKTVVPAPGTVSESPGCTAEAPEPDGSPRERSEADNSGGEGAPHA